MLNRFGIFFVLSLLSMPSKAIICPDGQRPMWYAANAIFDAFSSSDAACRNYDISQIVIGNPNGFHYTHAELQPNGTAICFYFNPSIPPPFPSQQGFINAAQRCTGDFVGKNLACASNGENLSGNPCNVATGNKYQSETDFFEGSLDFMRFYNSYDLSDLGLGKGWQNNYQDYLSLGPNYITLISASGARQFWSLLGDAWVGDEDNNDIISESATGYVITGEDGSFLDFLEDGRLIKKTNNKGQEIVYLYNSFQQLTDIEHYYGHTVSFEYELGKLKHAISPLGLRYTFAYDDDDNLASVIYPDQTPNDETDNPRRIYHYENPDFPNHLTGITDENGDRYASWSYDAQGRAISSEHAQTTNQSGQERVDIDF